MTPLDDNNGAFRLSSLASFGASGGSIGSRLNVLTRARGGEGADGGACAGAGGEDDSASFLTPRTSCQDLPELSEARWGPGKEFGHDGGDFGGARGGMVRGGVGGFVGGFGGYHAHLPQVNLETPTPVPETLLLLAIN